MTTYTLPNFGTKPQPAIETPMETSNVDGLTQDALAEQQAVFQRTGIMPEIASIIKKDKERQTLAINQEMNILTSGNFDPARELDDNTLEFDMAGSKSLNAKRQKFLEEYPNTGRLIDSWHKAITVMYSQQNYAGSGCYSLQVL